MGDLTILYLTDSQLDPLIRDVCIKYLLKAAGDVPIVSVSQKPLELGHNICVGDIGRSGLSMYKQIQAGLDAIDTKYVAIAEHDCIYTEEHFKFKLPDPEFFWYNINVWFVQYDNPRYPEWNGMYSYKRHRRVQSQLICNTDLFRKATKQQIEIVSMKEWDKIRFNMPCGEPGTVIEDKAMRLTRGRVNEQIRLKIKDFIVGYGAKEWRTRIPNIDIRHRDNLTGPRRGKNRTFDLPPWGEFKKIMEDK